MRYRLEFDIPEGAIKTEHPVGKAMQALFTAVRDANDGNYETWQESRPNDESTLS